MAGDDLKDQINKLLMDWCEFFAKNVKDLEWDKVNKNLAFLNEHYPKNGAGAEWN